MLKKYTFYEEQIKELMQDAFKQGFKVSQNARPVDSVENFFENWYKNYVYQEN